MIGPPEPTRRAEPLWLEPYPDALLDGIPDDTPGPDARYETREAVALAFVVGLQRMPPAQRAALVLRDVLGYRAAEVADMIGGTEASVASALTRARESLDNRLPGGGRERAKLPGAAEDRALVDRFGDAMEAGDMPGLVAMLTDDAWVTMPPQPHEYQGAEAILGFLEDRQAVRGMPFRVVPTRANGQPAFGCYLPTPESPIARAGGLIVVTVEEHGISQLTFFSDSGVFPYFGLPAELRRR